MKDKFLSKIRENINKYKLIEEGDTVIVALSGGADSISLLDSLVRIQKFNLEKENEPNFKIVAAHLNHCFRDEADRDELFCMEWSKKLGILAKSKKVDCNALAKSSGIGSEEAGRIARYEFFSDIAKEINGDDLSKIKIATGHNKNDQAETLLFRMFRGSGLDGIVGIAFKSINSFGNTVIRPILNIERKDIEAYCREKKLRYCKDETNFQPIYTRNKIRLELIPNIEKVLESNIIDSLWKLSENLREDKDYLENLAIKSYEETLLSKNSREISFSQQEMKKLPPSIWRRVIAKALYNLGLKQHMGKAQIDSIKSIVDIREKPKSVDITKDYRVVVAYGKVSCIRLDEEIKPLVLNVKKVKRENLQELALENAGFNTTEIGYVESSEEKHQKSIIISFDKLQDLYGSDVIDKVVLRKREAGDYIKLKKGRKKIKNLFIDMKIPKHTRENVDLVAIGSDILWVYDRQNGMSRISDYYRADDDTRTLLLIELKQ